MKKLLIFFLMSLSLVNCSVLEKPKKTRMVDAKENKTSKRETLPRNRQIGCSNSRLQISYNLYNKSKKFFASYYKTRKIAELFYAWYSSEDSSNMAIAVGRCRDKKNKHYFAVRSLAKSNRDIQDLIVQNMRLDNQTKITEVFMEDYKKIFPRDIQ